ncbi:MAG: AI-2E family transporter [Candidatus Promineifilaceae bacterium]
MKRLTLYAAVVMTTLTLTLLLYQFRGIILLLILAILVSAAIRPAILFLTNKFHIPRSAATMSVYLAGSAAVLLLLFIPGSAYTNELQTMFDNIATTYETRFPQWMEGTTIERAIASELPPPDQLYETLVGPIFGQQILGLTRGFLGLISGTAIILVLSIYWTIDQARLERYWLSILPAGWRVQARQIWREIEKDVGAYFRSEIIQSLAAAVLLGIVYSLVGIEYPLLLAGLAALFWLIPLAGAVLAVLPVLAVGFLNGSLGLSLVAALCALAILSGLEMIVEPRLFNRRRYNSTTTVLLMLVFVQDFGLVGLIMAPPITAALQILFNHWLEITTDTRKPAGEIALLQKRLEMTMSAQTQNGNTLTPELVSLGNRLSRLLDEANQLVPEE